MVRGDARAALVVVIPAVSGLVAAVVADVIAGGGKEALVIERLSAVVVVNTVVAALAHLGAFAATFHLARSRHFSSSPMAQPALIFALLRLGGPVMSAVGLVWPVWHQPLLGFAVALMDVAFIASTLLLVAPTYAQRAPRLAGAALCYSVYRLFFALGSFMPDPWIEPMFVAHRLVSVVVVAVVCGCFLGAARRMQALP